MKNSAQEEKSGSKEIKFMGSSLEDLKKFPKDAMFNAGYQLNEIQHGKNPADFKAISRVGKGAMELRIWDDEGTFRVLYVAKFEEAVYVLHCFKKKTQEISDADIELAKSRYKKIPR